MDGLTKSSALTDLPLSPTSSAYIGPSRAHMTGTVTPSGVTLAGGNKTSRSSASYASLRELIGRWFLRSQHNWF